MKLSVYDNGKKMKKVCVCGKAFESDCVNAKYCSEGCKLIGRKKANDSKTKRRRTVREARKEEKNQELVDVAVAARKAGMSYGQYVQKLRM